MGAQAPQTKAPAAATSADLPAIEPAAAAAVDRTGDYIKALKTFSIQAETSTDEVLMAGPKVQNGGSVDLTYQSPDKLRMRVIRDDMDDQRFFYDGATLTFWVPAQKVYGPSVAGVVAATVATAIVVGAVYSSLPPNCTTLVANGIAYQSGGGYYYQPRSQGSSVTYAVVNRP